jgi:hypothetical protein
MPQAQSGSLTKIAPVVFSLFLGGVGGYLFHSSVAASAGAPAPPSRGMSASPPPGGGGGRGGAGQGGGQPSSGATLSRTVRGLAMLENVQHKGLTAEQTQKMLPIAQEIQAAEKLPEKEAAAKLAAVEAVLTEEQKQAIQEMQPARGGRGGGGGGGGMGGGMPGGGGGRMPGSGGGMPGGGMPGGGAQQDPDKPFASERNKKGLEDLLASLKQPQKP